MNGNVLQFRVNLIDLTPLPPHLTSNAMVCRFLLSSQYCSKGKRELLTT